MREQARGPGEAAHLGQAEIAPETERIKMADPGVFGKPRPNFPTRPDLDATRLRIEDHLIFFAEAPRVET
jgi:hypothetical protein